MKADGRRATKDESVKELDSLQQMDQNCVLLICLLIYSDTNDFMRSESQRKYLRMHTHTLARDA